MALSLLAIVAIGLRLAGAARWRALIRTHISLLEASRVDAKAWPPFPTHFDAAELAGLPAPVQRYFRAALTDGQAMVAAVAIDMTGTMNMSTTALQWKSFHSRQRIRTRRPGFLWDAQLKMFPGLSAYVEDSYIVGRGRLIAKLPGLISLADSHGEGEIARGEFMRYFAEATWYPTALLPSQGVRWEAVDDASANATMVDGAITLSLRFHFDNTDLIASVSADSRCESVGKDGTAVMLPWDCRFSDYRAIDGMLIPQAGEAAWIRPAGRWTYFVGQLKAMRYEFAL